MKTALVLTNSSETYQLLNDILSEKVNLVLLSVPPEPTRAKFDALFATWLRLVDIVILDAVSLGESSRWAIEALGATRLREQQAVVVRAETLQRSLYSIPHDWLIVADTDTADQLKQSLQTYFHMRDMQAQLTRADVVLARQRHAVTPAPGAVASPGPGFDSYRYRDALKTMSRVLGQRLNEKALLDEFLRLVKELLGVGKLAIFTRRLESDFLTTELGLPTRHFFVGASNGIAQNVIDHFRLTIEAGLGACLAREARIVRRLQCADHLALDFDPRIAREFELLGTDVAVPMFDNDELLGVLTFSGKITGEVLTNEELELTYSLMSRLAQALRNLHLLDRLAGQQRLVSEVLANVLSGVVVVAENGRILSLNACARRLLDLEGADPIGQNLSVLPGRVGDVLFEALQVDSTLVEREVALPRSNRPLSVRVTRFPVNLGGVEATTQLVAVALIDDLTQLKQQQAQARELADKEFLTRLAARLSHELKNSLVCIKTFTQLLPERYQDQEFRDQCSTVVSSEVNRIDMLISNLTFFSHPLELVYEQITLSDLLDTSLKRISLEFERKKQARLVMTGEKTAEVPAGMPVVAVKKTFQHKLLHVEGDRIRLMQAVEHLLRNSVQAMPAGGRLSLSTADAQPADFPDGKIPAGGAVRIECFDTGEGIALENLKRVTEPFVTTRNVGIGLGLTIAKKIVERHSGRLDIDSNLGHETRVVLTLPAQAQPHPEDEEIAKLSQAESAQADAAATERRLPLTAPAEPAKKE